ncbi:glycosyltransferase [Corynebacterium qintianiae]|uniref:Glycosyltransferase n=1 Tax=Corynebacterium qintianiae TaxID=2709392 RepID=A0A7T0KLL9_9CORY|nr:glycosyltransferase [Corynebacterium qintianiae]QPK82777.1 glycosyltransferase [Corynebacterium qintianiae]
MTTKDDGPVYLVAQGSDADFRKLSQGSGFAVDEFQGVEIRAAMRAEGKAYPTLLFLEFDGNRNRIGELKFKANGWWRGKFLDETAFILPTIRIAGSGEVSVSALHFEFSEKLELTSPTRIAEVKEPTSDILGGKRRSAQFEDALEKLKNAASDVLALTKGDTKSVGNDVPQFPTAETDRSKYRESLVKSVLEAMAAGLPTSNGSHHHGVIPARVGIITDEYMFNFYRDVFEETIYLSPGNFEKVIDTVPLDAILYVTCWRGMANDEWKGVKFRERPKAALEAILEYANKNSIPTIFQSIEDPSNFEYFLPVAAKFDFIFTSDAEVIESYKRELGHSRVYYGEYGANPAVNNPIGNSRVSLNYAFFAGSYPERYAERTADMQTVFDSVIKTNGSLVILDRNFDIEGFDFPGAYQRFILGPVSHERLQKIHKLFQVSLNFNSIKSSSTMCAMRVYELQAQGLPIVSNYARSVFNKFPEIRLVPQETNLSLFNDENEYIRELEVANRMATSLFLERSSYAVVGEMARICGLPRALDRNSEILVVAPNEQLAEITKLVQGQSGVSATVMGLCDFDASVLDSYGYVTFMDPRFPYSRHYLAGKMAAFVYTNCHFVTQAGEYDPSGSSICKTVANEYTELANRRELTLVSTDHPDAFAFVSGGVGFISGSGYQTPSYDVGFAEWDAKTSNASLESTPIITVIIPVYNNGRFLAAKCLPSLRRNDSWSRMKVLVVDDGSTDVETLTILKELESLYSNISTFYFGDGGSGSASRPRNKGIELADTELVTFLDPDNEISSGGYDSLIATFERNRAAGEPTEFVSGYQLKVGETVKITGKHARGGAVTVDNPRSQYFEKGKFPVVSTQAAVINSRFLKRENLTFIENAVGQDTLYGWQVLMRANRPVFTDEAYLIYYAERSDSVTNQVGEDFFTKSHTMERAQVRILKELGIFEAYKQHQLPNFVRNWYGEKLRRVSAGERRRAMELVGGICALYGYEYNQLLGDASEENNGV